MDQSDALHWICMQQVLRKESSTTNSWMKIQEYIHIFVNKFRILTSLPHFSSLSSFLFGTKACSKTVLGKETWQRSYFDWNSRSDRCVKHWTSLRRICLTNNDILRSRARLMQICCYSHLFLWYNSILNIFLSYCLLFSVLSD